MYNTYAIGHTHIRTSTIDNTCESCVCMVIHMLLAVPPIDPLDLVSWSDLPVWMYRLNQPAFVFWPDDFEDLSSVGSFRIAKSCGRS